MEDQADTQIQQAQEAELKLKKLMSVVLEPNAYDRLMNVRLSNQELYLNIANACIHLYQKKKKRITENELITLINMNLAVHRQPETKIHIRRK
jgi:DNA-binding TFAR19-related protein (PDSD5 family)